MKSKQAKKKTAGRPPKSAKRKGAAPNPPQPLPTSTNALNFLYEQIVINGGLQAIDKKLHGAIFNAFQIVENDLKRIPALEEKLPKEDKKEA